jgi:predicted RNase H-like HicB family nuclease
LIALCSQTVVTDSWRFFSLVILPMTRKNSQYSKMFFVIVKHLRALAKLKYMLTTFTANYTKIDSGYMGQLIEWQEVITEGETLELCRESLQDALQEMIAAYKQQNKEIPSSESLIEQIPVEV